MQLFARWSLTGELPQLHVYVQYRAAFALPQSVLQHHGRHCADQQVVD